MLRVSSSDRFTGGDAHHLDLDENEGIYDESDSSHS